MNWLTNLLSSSEPNLRQKATGRVAIFGVATAVILWGYGYVATHRGQFPDWLPHLLDFKPVAWVLAILPSLMFMAAVVEIVTGMPFWETVQRWDQLPQWQQITLYFVICMLAVIGFLVIGFMLVS